MTNLVRRRAIACAKEAYRLWTRAAYDTQIKADGIPGLSYTPISGLDFWTYTGEIETRSSVSGVWGEQQIWVVILREGGKLVTAEQRK